MLESTWEAVQDDPAVEAVLGVNAQCVPWAKNVELKGVEGTFVLYSMVPSLLVGRKFTPLEDHEIDFTGLAALIDSSSASVSMHSASLADNNMSSREIIHVTNALLSHATADTKKKVIKMLAKDYGLPHHPNQSRMLAGIASELSRRMGAVPARRASRAPTPPHSAMVVPFSDANGSGAKYLSETSE